MRNTGKACESAACDYLVNKGYRIKDRNYTVKGGEIDIIAEDSEYIVFVEVKARSAGYDITRFGRPSDAVTAEKKRHFRTAASSYLRMKGSVKKPRIDVIEILIHEHEEAVSMEIVHFKGAF